MRVGIYVCTGQGREKERKERREGRKKERRKQITFKVDRVGILNLHPLPLVSAPKWSETVLPLQRISFQYSVQRLWAVSAAVVVDARK